MKRVITLVAFVALFATGAQAQMVGATNNSSPGKTTSSYYRPTGHYLRVEAGFPNFISVAYGYQVASWFRVGAGAGFGMMTYYYHEYYDSYYDYYSYGYETLGIGFPVYTELTFNTPRYKWAFFVDWKIGVNIAADEYDYNGSYYDSYNSYYVSDYLSKSGHAFYSALNLGVSHKGFDFYGGINTNSAEMFFSLGVAYNFPLKVK